MTGPLRRGEKTIRRWAWNIASIAPKSLMTHEQIQNTFTYHKPFGTQQKRYEEIRECAKSLAHLFAASCPQSRETSLAFTNLQQAVMWANAAIAINEKEPA